MRPFNGKQVTVLGFGRSGRAAAEFLLKHGAVVTVVDDKPVPEGETCGKALEEKGGRLIYANYNTEDVLRCDLLVVSPGVRLDHKVCEGARKKGVEIKGEIELAAGSCPNEIIGITGTNGKSTVTGMISHMLNACQMPAITAGNIGNPLIGELDRIRPDCKIVLELSSFQLAYLDKWAPHVAILLNITPDHIDWHGSFDDYREAKMRIFRGQKGSDFAVINKEIASNLSKDGISARTIDFDASKDDCNIMVCNKLGKIYGLTQAQINLALRSYSSLPHRMERVETNEDYTIINDSKSTNIASLRWALRQSKQPVVLIAGGRQPGVDFNGVSNLIEAKVKTLIAIGETREKLLRAWSGVQNRIQAETLLEAVTVARAHTKSNEILLFSPGCKSFDMFRDFKDRGEQFKACIRKTERVNTYV